MKNKKITMGLTALVLMGTMVLPVSAEEKSDTTRIKANVKSTYTLTIPAETTVNFEATSTDLNGALKVKGNVLSTQEVVVNATANDFHNTSQNKDLPYKLVNKAEGKEFSIATWDEDILRAGLSDGQGKEILLSVDITDDNWNKAEAGDYEGSITFIANLMNKQ
ncbi:hypothetical protein SAMN02745196_00819 [Clostridium collagenovorans DSM 3089]|uniref:Uncharacterized protein n=1 Tax=Clostridium collagenovorans DSM 3089 TaxID=1121306 RepID=A0A1M5U2V9_9CLOT|nr:polymer-forming cytoskeletal protein [Clostridium collagenovorans]SHH57200.1 hypothetical protein SAMN02745196_00819 [Clostridium collagenovorans DSM 3089]